jgi:peptidoglycan/LPS O-acetylase OafA/YrhL
MIHREISDKKFQMDSLDGLRGFAALIVVFSHTSNVGMFFIPFLDLRGIGKSGVFLFFLLSSFLLTLPLLKKGREVLSFPVMSNYWQRRFFRIYPLYTIYLLLAAASTLVIFLLFGKSGIGIPFALDFYGFLNHLALQEGKGVTWSIAVEFKFYFILPIFIFGIVFVRNYGNGALLLLFFVLLILSQLVLPQSESTTNDARLLSYMPIFIIGIFLAVLQDYINTRKNKPQYVTLVLSWMGYIGLGGAILMTPLVFSMFGDKVPNNFFHKQFILYAVVWSLVILSAVNVDGFIKIFFTLKFLRFYGAVSFSLYLFHVIFISALTFIGEFYRTELNGYISAWGVLFGSTVAAYISFRLLESPISKYKLSRSFLKPVAHILRHFTGKK